MIFRKFKKIKKAFSYSLSGLKSAFISEESFQIEVIISLFFFTTLFFFSFKIIEKLFLSLIVVLILSIELLNSAIEKSIDELGGGRVCQRFRFAKDCGSAAVFCLIVFFLVSFGVLLMNA